MLSSKATKSRCLFVAAAVVATLFQPLQAWAFHFILDKFVPIEAIEAERLLPGVATAFPGARYFHADVLYGSYVSINFLRFEGADICPGNVCPTMVIDNGANLTLRVLASPRIVVTSFDRTFQVELTSDGDRDTPHTVLSATLTYTLEKEGSVHRLFVVGQ